MKKLGVLLLSGVMLLASCGTQSVPQSNGAPSQSVSGEQGAALVQQAKAHPSVQALSSTLQREGVSLMWSSMSTGSARGVMSLRVPTSRPDLTADVLFSQGKLIGATLAKTVHEEGTARQLEIVDFVDGYVSQVTVATDTAKVQSVQTGRAQNLASLNAAFTLTPLVALHRPGLPLIRTQADCSGLRDLLNAVNDAGYELDLAGRALNIAKAAYVAADLGLSGCFGGPIACAGVAAAFALAAAELSQSQQEFDFALYKADSAKARLAEFRRSNPQCG